MLASHLQPQEPSVATEATVRVTQETDDVVAIGLDGEFDMANAPLLVEHAERALEDGRDLIVDLSDASFIDSAVLNAIIGAHRAASERGRRVVLQLGTAAVVERLVELTGLERLLPRATTRAEAIRILERRAT